MGGFHKRPFHSTKKLFIMGKQVLNVLHTRKKEEVYFKNYSLKASLGNHFFYLLCTLKNKGFKRVMP